MDIGTKNELLNRIAYNDNEIGKIYRDNYEYVIEINMWNGDIRILKTVNCRKIVLLIKALFCKKVIEKSLQL